MDVKRQIVISKDVLGNRLVEAVKFWIISVAVQNGNFA